MKRAGTGKVCSNNFTIALLTLPGTYVVKSFQSLQFELIPRMKSSIVCDVVPRTRCYGDRHSFPLCFCAPLCLQNVKNELHKIKQTVTEFLKKHSLCILNVKNFVNLILQNMETYYG